MIFIWGKYHCGRTDEVPGMFHVATEFGHLWFIPLLPSETHLLFEGADDETSGIKIPFSCKSWLLGWGRVGSFLTGAVATIMFTAGWERGIPWTPAAVAVFSFALYGYLMFAHRFRFASHDRAHQLATLAGVNRRGRILIDTHFGLISEAEAGKRLADSDLKDLADEEKALARRKEDLRRRGTRSAPEEATQPSLEEEMEHLCMRCGAMFEPKRTPWHRQGYCSARCKQETEQTPF